MPGEQDKSLWRRDAEIFFVSALILYLELVLIRWMGTEVRVFAFLGNLVLVVCFFGSGLGCFMASRPVSMNRLGINLLLLTIVVANPLHLPQWSFKGVTDSLSGFEDSLIWITANFSWLLVLGGLLIVGLMVYLIVFAFVPLGQILGQAFQQHPHTVRAYSVNIAGSLAGVWLFNAVSWAALAPWSWFGIASALLAVGWRRERVAIGLTALAAVAVWMGREPALRTVWSPYHRLTLTPFYAEDGTNKLQQGYVLDVNGTFYQHILNLSDTFLSAHAEVFDKEWVHRGHYDLPFNFTPTIRRMLIVGAGSGNDAAAALRHGAEHVDCVEIDPQIYALGKELHPERPYDSPRVRVTLDDARAFFKRATGTYDLIWFGWLDSHTLGSSYNNLRLDNYVYTRESLEEACRLLTDDGVLILSFGAERLWVADRLCVMLREVFGHDPVAYLDADIPRKFGGGGGVTLVCAKHPLTVETVRDPAPREFIRSRLVKLPATTTPTTDDWPYLYLQARRIPKLHLVTTLAILGAVVLARQRLLGLRGGIDLHFLALGAAFLLLEVQTVSRATLLFGMTWVVNAIVISAVLVMILLSNLVAARWPKLPQWFIMTGLAATMAALALVPLDWFNGLTGATKLAAASAFLTAPVFFAGLIFIRSFAACSDKSQALGSNLIGALVGGLLESVSFVTGIRALVLLVGLFYLVALWLRPRLPHETQAAD